MMKIKSIYNAVIDKQCVARVPVPGIKKYLCDPTNKNCRV